jgi:hypothetical protein
MTGLKAEKRNKNFSHNKEASNLLSKLLKEKKQ